MKFTSALSVALLSSLPAGVFASSDVLATNGFTTCGDNATVQVNTLNIAFDRSTNIVTFDVSGTSTEQQNVTAHLSVSAYGTEFYSKDFNPCDNSTYVEKLCPVPQGQYSAHGTQKVPVEYASMIPSIAYTIPDLDGMAKLELKSNKTGLDVACVQSTVSNEKTTTIPGVSWAAGGVVAASLAVSGIGAAAAAIGGGGSGSTGAATASPTFTEVVHWFQGMALNGMLSVQYPSVYRDFARNFAFSTGLIPWTGVQTGIDNFRAATGGNLTHDSVQWLQNSTLVYQTSSKTKRDIASGLFQNAMLAIRDVEYNTNGTAGAANGTSNSTTNASKNQNYVQGIQGYVEELRIPQSNTFMTVLLVFSIALAAVTAGILLFKVILEAWALFGKFPKKLTSFRKNYWWTLGKTITNLILLLYGVWVLYCVYQFKNGDSWAAKTLAGVTLALFTATLLAFTFRIHHLAHKFKKSEGDTSQLFEDKETWRKYSIFYDSYKRSYWWLFVPAIIYMFARGCVIAGADGHGLIQTAGQLIVESLMLLLLIFLRPYTLKSGNWINLIIQAVRVISVVCVLIFVEELGFSQTTKTVTGVILIVVQSVLTGVLAILIAVNALINCCRMNPHRKQRKEQEQFHKNFDDVSNSDSQRQLIPLTDLS